MDGLEVLMFQWLWKQKYRVDRGLGMAAGLNTLLLLCQSEKLAHLCGLSLQTFVLVAAPLIFTGIWLCGYIVSRPSLQIAEDGAIGELSQQRRELREILQILKERK